MSGGVNDVTSDRVKYNLGHIHLHIARFRFLSQMSVNLCSLAKIVALFLFVYLLLRNDEDFDDVPEMLGANCTEN